MSNDVLYTYMSCISNIVQFIIIAPQSYSIAEHFIEIKITW